MALVYEDMTAVLRACFFDVQNEVGLGRREEAYHRACELWLEQNRVPFRSKPAHHLALAGESAVTLFPDFVVRDSITVELKAQAKDLQDTDFVQIFDYLKCRGDRLGLLVNMGLDRVRVKRLVYDAPHHDVQEDWKHWQGQIHGRERELGMEVRKALQSIFKKHGTGYGSEVTGKLIVFELRRRCLPFVVWSGGRRISARLSAHRRAHTADFHGAV